MTPKLNQNLDEKVRFLAAPGVLAPDETPASRETHMSWVFLTKELVFKLKKPVRHSYLDFSTCSAREVACREELRINQRLAPGVYLRLVRLTCEPGGGLCLDGPGETADWLVVMRRLPAEFMLDNRIRAGAATPAGIARLVEHLLGFYRTALQDSLTPEDYVDRFRMQLTENRKTISLSRFAIDHGRAHAVMDRLDVRLSELDDVIRQRVSEGRIVEGHGDLRPEHVWLGDPIRVIDRIEFNRDLRMVDPFDELAFLGMECAVAGANWVAPILIRAASDALGAPPAGLIDFYTAMRASLRARLSLAHLLDPQPRDPAKWEPQAERYLDQAACALNLPRRQAP